MSVGKYLWTFEVLSRVVHWNWAQNEFQAQKSKWSEKAFKTNRERERVKEGEDDIKLFRMNWQQIVYKQERDKK